MTSVSQLGEVIDLAVVDDPNRAVFVEDRLMAPRQIDDTQAAHAQADAIFYEYAFVIGTTIDNRLAHPVDGLSIHRSRRATDNSRDSAHALALHSG
jgi:hypothetical protein